MNGMQGFLAVSVVSLLTTALGYLLVRRSAGHAGSGAVFAGLAAGVMGWLAFAEALPEAGRVIGWQPALVSFTVVAFVAVVGSWLWGRRTAAAAAALPAMVLFLHDLPEGYASASVAGALSTAALAVFVVSLVIHNLPEKVTVLAAMTEGGNRRTTLGLVAAALLPEPFGAAVAGIGHAVSPSVSAYALAGAAGAMVALSLGVLPRSHIGELPRFGRGALSGLSAAVAIALLPLP